MSGRATPLLVLAGVLFVVALMCLFTVNENEVAIRTQWGQIQRMNYGPGLHLKWPAPIDRVVKFERRIITDNYTGETFLTSENKGLTVDFYIKWRINDVGHFFRTTGGSEVTAGSRLGEIVKDGIKGVVAQRTLQDIVVAERTAFTGDMFERASVAVTQLGIELIDVRVQRIDLPDEVSGSVYQRMQEGFRGLANRLRAEGSAEAERIRSEAERKRTETLSAAARDGQRIRGEGDAAAATIHARAYGKVPEFYQFYRSLQAYRNSLGKEGDIMVISPDGEFFRYLDSANSRPGNR